MFYLITSLLAPRISCPRQSFPSSEGIANFYICKSIIIVDTVASLLLAVEL